jgi:hypothetical protein
VRILLPNQRLLLRILLVLGLAGALTLVTYDGCVSANAQPSATAVGAELELAFELAGQTGLSNTAPGPSAVSCTDAGEWGPEGLAPAFTEKVFWVVLGLVVLGWLVLAADFPANES